LNLRKNNPALSANASFKKLATTNDAALYAFEREKNGSKVLVILNLSKQAQQIAWKAIHLKRSGTMFLQETRNPLIKALALNPGAMLSMS
jgi:glycosidase